MSKKRILVSIVFNFILFMAIIRGLLLRLNYSNIIDNLRYAEFVCPIILAFIVVLYILSLVHSFNSNSMTCKFIEGIRLIFVSFEVVIMIVEILILMPYRGSFDISGSGIYLYIVIPILSLVSILVTKRNYSIFALAYGIIGSLMYLSIISSLVGLRKIDCPYRFMDVYYQRAYKSVINYVVVLGINEIVVGIITTVTKTKRVVKN